MANYVSYANAETLMQGIADKFDELGGAYIAKGSRAFADLEAGPTKSLLGYVYNVTDDFTTDARFIEGAGKKYPAGTNVVVAEVDNSGVKSYLYDVLGNFIDVDSIEDRIDNTQGMVAAAFDDTEDYTIGDVVIYEDKLYKCTTAHSAGAWADGDFTETTVTELIEAAEPDSLTQTQLDALLALLD